MPSVGGPGSPAAGPSRTELLEPEAEIARKPSTASATSGTAPSWMFAAICLLQVLANFDNGVLPSVLSAVQAEFDLDFSELGLLGALVYVGLVASCPISGYLLTRCGSPRLVLVGSVALNAGALFLFAAAPAPGFLLVARALIGLSQAPIFIYAPVWVDMFAPEANMTLWISLLQANVAIGIMLGYVFGGAMVAGVGPESWRVPLYVQACLMAPFAVFYLVIPDRYVSPVGDLAARIAEAEERAEGEDGQDGEDGAGVLDTLKEEEEEEEEEEGEARGGRAGGGLGDDDDGAGGTAPRQAEPAVAGTPAGPSPGGEEEDEAPISLLEGTCALLCNRIFMLLTVGLTGLYFVVTGIQFWISDYLVKGIGADPASVVAGFAVTSLTAPTLGVFFGGWLVDRMGGYKDDTGQSAFVTLRVCCLFGLGAAGAAVPAAFVSDFWGILVSVWFVLFFGGALLPAVTGVAITSIPPELRSVGNALSLLTYNLLGYAAAPYLCGVIASSVGIAWGFRVVMAASFVALVPIVIASVVAKPSALDPEMKPVPAVDDDEPAAPDDAAPAPDDPEAALRARPVTAGPLESASPEPEIDDVEAAELYRARLDDASASGRSSSVSSAATTARRPRARSRRETMTDALVSALAVAIGLPDPGPAEAMHPHRQRRPTAAAASPRHPPRSRSRTDSGSIAPSSEAPSAGSTAAAGRSPRARRLSALHMTGPAHHRGRDDTRRRRGTSLALPGAVAPRADDDPSARRQSHAVPRARKPRRVSGMVAVLGDISMHASRGRAVTSFFRTRHIFEGIEEEQDADEEDMAAAVDAALAGAEAPSTPARTEQAASDGTAATA